MARQIALEFKRQRDFDDELLGDAAEHVLDALHREAPFVAFGPGDLPRPQERHCERGVHHHGWRPDADAERTIAHLNEYHLRCTGRRGLRGLGYARDAVPA